MKLSKIVGSNPTTNFLFVLFLILLVLKVTKIVTISWWIVTAPLWGPLGILLLFLLGFYAHVSLGGFLGKNPEGDE